MITIQNIEDSLCSLDTEYREALAKSLMKLNYISASPLELTYGTEEQQKEWEKFERKPLKAKQIEEIIKYIMEDMKGDFQYGAFKSIASEYITLAKTMSQKEKKRMER